MLNSDYSGALHSGTIVADQYRIAEVLGKPGAFGITYLAEDMRLETNVALKEFLPRELAGRGADHTTVVAHSGERDRFRHGLDQFVREARTLARFNHPNVVRVRTFVEANSTAYLVMDFYEGQTLADLLTKHGGRLPVDTAVAVIDHVLDGLRATHAQNILHRDIKPANIYILTSGLPVLLDFGAARQSLGPNGDASMTAVLTPGFAPVEQYGQRGQGPWTDIYAAGAVLYMMLTGIQPPPATDRITDDPLVPPSVVDPSIPRSISDAVMRGLAVSSNDRARSAEEFQGLLEQAARSPRIALRANIRDARSARAVPPSTPVDRPAPPRIEQPQPRSPKPEAPKPRVSATPTPPPVELPDIRAPARATSASSNQDRGRFVAVAVTLAIVTGAGVGAWKLARDRGFDMSPTLLGGPAFQDTVAINAAADRLLQARAVALQNAQRDSTAKAESRAAHVRDSTRIARDSTKTAAQKTAALARARFIEDSTNRSIDSVSRATLAEQHRIWDSVALAERRQAEQAIARAREDSVRVRDSIVEAARLAAAAIKARADSARMRDSVALATAKRDAAARAHNDSMKIILARNNDSEIRASGVAKLEAAVWQLTDAIRRGDSTELKAVMRLDTAAAKRTSDFLAIVHTVSPKVSGITGDFNPVFGAPVFPDPRPEKNTVYVVFKLTITYHSVTGNPRDPYLAQFRIDAVYSSGVWQTVGIRLQSPPPKR